MSRGLGDVYKRQVTLYFKKYNDPKYTEDLSKYSLNPSDITVSKVQ